MKKIVSNSIIKIVTDNNNHNNIVNKNKIIINYIKLKMNNLLIIKILINNIAKIKTTNNQIILINIKIYQKINLVKRFL